MKNGRWFVSFELVLEGEDVKWESLSETTQEHILKLIGEGYVCGEICEED